MTTEMIPFDSPNPFKIGDIVSFKVDNVEDGRLISKDEALIVSLVSGCCIYFHGSGDPWMHVAFRLR